MPYGLCAVGKDTRIGRFIFFVRPYRPAALSNHGRVTDALRMASVEGSMDGHGAAAEATRLVSTRLAR